MTNIILYLLVVHLLAHFIVDGQQNQKKFIPVASLFRNEEEAELQCAFREALHFHNTNNLSHHAFVVDDTERLMKSEIFDIWEITQMTCMLAKRGFFYLLGSGDYKNHNAFASVSRTLNMPFINWALPSAKYLNEYEVSLKPSLSKVISEILEVKGWTIITYLYDSPQGLFNFDEMSHLLRQKGVRMQVKLKILPETEEDEMLSQFFYNFHESQSKFDNHVILDISTSKKLNRTLTMLQKVAVKSRNFHYIIASLEITARDIFKFRQGVVNITGVQLIDRSTYEYWKVINRWRHLDNYLMPMEKHEEISVDAALTYDSVGVVVNALINLLSEHPHAFNQTLRTGEFLSNGSSGVYCYASENKANFSSRTMENGKLLAKALRHVKSVGLTGPIEFGSDGFRKNYELNIVELLYSGDNVQHSIEKKSKWIEGIGFVRGSEVSSSTTSQPSIDNIFDGRELIITTIISKPFVMEKQNAEGLVGNDKYEGYCVDLMHLIAQNLSRKYKIQIVKDKKYGNVGTNGVWDGMIGELLRNEADMAVAPLTINRQRERVVDFSKPFMTTGISIMIKKPDKQEFSVFSFMQPLSKDVWMYIIFAYVGVSMMIFLVARFSPYEWRVEENANGNLVVSNDFSLYNCLWFTLAAFMQQGTDILPRSVSTRIGSSTWWFFTMIIVSSYTANLAAFLTLERMHPPIGSAEDLAKQTKIKYGIQENGSTATFFKESTVPIYQRMWSYMSTEKGVLTKDYDEGITKVRESKGRYAFLLEATSNEFANTRKPCDTMKVGDNNLNTLGYGVATKFGSPLRNRINLIVLELLERGELKKLENRWWYEKSQCEQGIMTDSQSASLTLSKVAGIFYILIAGMVLAMVAALGEFVYRSRMELGQGNRALTSMVQTRLSIPCSKAEVDRS